MDSPATFADLRRVRRLAPCLLLLAALLAAGPSAASQEPAAPAADTARREPWVSPPLFDASDPLTITVRTDLRTLVADRDSLERARHDATVLLHGAGGRVDTISARLRTRGHFRRQARICDFPPLQVQFRSGMRGTPFARQEEIKLVTKCQAGRDEYEQYVLREYAAYRILNALTDRSFRARLVRVTYEDVARRHPGLTTHAFFVEPEKDLVRRLVGRLREDRNARLHDLDSTRTHVVALFQLMVGNTDWDIAGLHNIVLVESVAPAPDAMAIYPVPYDFDWTGLVDARYAFPDGRLPIRSVRDRLWRGYCVKVADLAPAIAHVVERRAAVTAAMDSVPALDERSRATMRSYVDEFYALVANGGALQRQIDVRCIRP